MKIIRAQKGLVPGRICQGTYAKAQIKFWRQYGNFLTNWFPYKKFISNMIILDPYCLYVLQIAPMQQLGFWSSTYNVALFSFDAPVGPCLQKLASIGPC